MAARRGRCGELFARGPATAEDFASAHEQLGSCLRWPITRRPRNFWKRYSRDRSRDGANCTRRLGLAARDPIDELMTAALTFERSEVPSLERFHGWFARGDVEIQRDPSERANAVRVMTVQAPRASKRPYVIIADATADPANLGSRNPPLNFYGFGGEPVP